MSLAMIRIFCGNPRKHAMSRGSDFSPALLCVLAIFIVGCGKTNSGAPATDDAEKVVNLYIWADYVAPDTLSSFEKRTGIKVNVTYFDTLAVPETRLLTGQTGFDVVVTTPPFFRGLIAGGAFQPLDKQQLPNLVNLNPALMAKIADDDPGNAYAVMYTWGTNGIAYNDKKIAAALPNGAPKSWSLIFDPVNAAKLANCHINTVDTPASVVPIVLSYLRRDFRNPTPQDLDDAADILRKIRPYIHNIDTAGQIEAMANGDACVAFDSNADAFLARRRAKEASNGININYVIPEEGSLIWFDLLAIPKDAPHVVNAHRLINYLMDPRVIADITDYIGLANANSAAIPLLDPSIASDPMVYPPPETLKRLFPCPEYTPEQTRAITRLWQRFKTGQ
jgi:putrescine transport system substrate-binding protein